MNFDKTPQDHSPHFQRQPIPLLNSGSQVAVYTGLKILATMRAQLGLEAMVEYMDTYLSLIEKDNPRLKSAVSQALTLMSVEKIYHDTVHLEKE